MDDSITQNLNALVTPSRGGFDPASTAVRGVGVGGGNRAGIDAGSCRRFKEQVLFPSWQSRSDVLTYCAYVATSPDPDDPEMGLRAAETERERERVVDERLDPYSARYFPREARTERLASLLRSERGVEGIVRSRTWAVVQERCGEGGLGGPGGAAQEAEQALNRWRQQREARTPPSFFGSK